MAESMRGHEAHMPMCGTFSSKCRTDSNRHGMGTKRAEIKVALSLLI